MSTNKHYLNWEEINFTWDHLDMLWEDIAIFTEVDELVRKGGGYGEYAKENPWENLRKDIGKEKTKKVLKLYCKVNGIDYEETIEKNEDIKVSVNEFERFVTEGMKIKIDVKVNN
jgi:hypothetical protein